MQIRRFIQPGIVLVFAFMYHSSLAQLKPGKNDWISLFNGKDISDWFVKIQHHETGDNYGNTFRVEDGILKAAIENANIQTAKGRM